MASEEPFFGVEEKADDPTAELDAFGDRFGVPEATYWHEVERAAQHALGLAAAPGGQTWRALGPRNIGGRVRDLKIDPDDPNTIYAGTPFGGVWRTTDKGRSWTVLGQPQDAIPVSSIDLAIDRTPVPARRFLYLGSGEPSGFGGRGLWRVDLSTGAFTQLVGPPPHTGAAPDGAANTHHRVFADPRDHDRVWTATDTGLWRREASGRFSNDARRSAVITDVVVDTRTAASYRVYFAVHDDGVYRYDFTTATATASRPNRIRHLPQRIRLGVSGDHVYAVGSTLTFLGGTTKHLIDALHHSPDRGDRWHQRTAPPPQYKPGGRVLDDDSITFHALVLAVHPTAPNVVFVGAVDLFRSDTEGRSWTRVINWLDDDQFPGKHADQHAVAFEPGGERAVWVGNDGGAAYSEDLGVSWRKRSYGLLAAQFVDITHHPRFPFVLGGGLQDNGTFVGYGGRTWYQVGGGDGGMLAFDPTEVRRLFVSSQVALRRADLGTGSRSENKMAFLADRNTPMRTDVEKIDVAIPSSDEQLFIGRVVHHPTDRHHLLLGRKRGAYLGRIGSPPGDDVEFTRTHQVANDEEVTALAYSPANPDTHWWIGTSKGRVFRTTNGGTWNPIAIAGVADAYVTAIQVNPQNGDMVGIATGKKRDAGTPGRLFLSEDANVATPTWHDVSGRTGPGLGLPPSTISAIGFDPTDPHIYAAATVGVYRMDYSGGLAPPAAHVWGSFIGNLPLVLVSDLEFAPTIGGRRRLRAATFGRGIFEVELDFARPATRLFLKQHVFDDPHSFARDETLFPFPDLGGDPRRLPVPFNHAADAPFHGFDIRVDAAPLRRFPSGVDPSEFDVELGSEDLKLGEPANVYVQVHDGGAAGGPSHPVVVALFWALGRPTPALPANFWTEFIAGRPPPAGPWDRIGQSTEPLAPDQDAVRVFSWTPPAAARGEVNLLAVCSSGTDPISATAPLAIEPLVQTERRVCLRRVTAQPEVYIRQAFASAARPGAATWPARSPDIVIAPAGMDPNVAFRDLTLRAPGGPLRAGNNNVHVRVHNRSAVPVDARVDVYVAPADSPWEIEDPPRRIANNVAVPAVPARGSRFSPAVVFAPPDDRPYVIVATVGVDFGPFPPSVREPLLDFWRGLQTDRDQFAVRAFRRN